jgi:hypothetical protein
MLPHLAVDRSPCQLPCTNDEAETSLSVLSSGHPSYLRVATRVTTLLQLASRDLQRHLVGFFAVIVFAAAFVTTFLLVGFLVMGFLVMGFLVLTFLVVTFLVVTFLVATTRPTTSVAVGFFLVTATRDCGFTELGVVVEIAGLGDTLVEVEGVVEVGSFVVDVLGEAAVAVVVFASVLAGELVVVVAGEITGAARITGATVDVDVDVIGVNVSGAVVEGASVSATVGVTVVAVPAVAGSSPLLMDTTTWAKLVGLPLNRDVQPGTSWRTIGHIPYNAS